MAQSPLRLALLLIALVFTCFGLSPVAQAVSPAPDGDYPGGNTAEGQAALLSLTTGSFNTGVGFLSLRSNATGQLNTAIGAGTLLANTADENTATSAVALLNNTTGSDNTANGAFALFSNTTGPANVAIGSFALFSNTTGAFNTAVKASALDSNTVGGGNTANGFQALVNNTTGSNNTANGYQVLSSNTTGFTNTAIGYGALFNNTTGNNNVALGVGAGFSVTTASSVIAIGSVAVDVGISCFIGNIRNVQTVNNDAIPVVIDSAGQLGTMSSSRRFKKEIKPMDKASETILALKPVTFHYKSDKRDTPQFGLIAEEVSEVNPDLVVRNKDGEIYTVRYDAVNAMLLNEFLKEHKAFLEEYRTVEELKKQVAALTAGLQKVSAQIEANKPAPQVVNNL